VSQVEQAACYCCGSAEPEPFFEQRAIPVHSCRMLSSREEALSFPCADLRLDFCHACGFIQNGCFDPGLLDYASDYEETQGFSPRFRRFQRELCEHLARRYGLGPSDRVLEIGCGKGEFLAELCELSGCTGAGIDPGYRPERLVGSVAERIHVERDLFEPRQVEAPFDLLCCRHTLEHIQPVSGFLEAVRGTLERRRDVSVFFEVPDTGRILEQLALEDVYFEHCSYFSAASLAGLFRRQGFEVTDLRKGFAGQYLLLEARLAGGSARGGSVSDDDLARNAKTIRGFQAGVDEKCARLQARLDDLDRGGERAVLWGSGSKAVSLLAHLEVDAAIDGVVDINPHKHGRFLAGSGQEIIAPACLGERRPEWVIVMNSIYTKEIRASLDAMGLDAKLWVME
jgi:SAM-dependent methyltransferase